MRMCACACVYACVCVCVCATKISDANNSVFMIYLNVHCLLPTMDFVVVVDLVPGCGNLHSRYGDTSSRSD